MLQVYVHFRWQVLVEWASEVGVSLSLGEGGVEAQGPSDSLAQVSEQLSALTATIKTDRITYRKPATARYNSLTGGGGGRGCCRSAALSRLKR